MSDYDFGQTRSFNLGVAKETSINAALVYDELAFWASKSTSKSGWLYKTYQDMSNRLPLTEYQLREAYKKLQESGYLEFKLMRANGAPTLHFRILRNLRMESKETSESIESKETSESITATTTNKTSIRSETKKAVEKSATERKDYRGKYSPAKEKMRDIIHKKGVRSLANLTGG